MKHEIHIELTDEAGIPVARVPHELAWDLVDYLSNQRLCVTYRYQESHVVAYFHHTDRAIVQKLLDSWSLAAPAPSAATQRMPHLDRWLVGHNA